MTESIIDRVEKLSAKRKKDILESRDRLFYPGKAYYVSSEGDDGADGLSESTAWRSLEKVSSADLSRGDAVLFRRGDVFRGCVYAKAGVAYGAYGSGPKPRLYGWDRNLADPALWEIFDAGCRIWKLKERILDVGTLVFEDDEKCSYKHIPSYINGRFVCRDDEDTVFDMRREMKGDLDIYWHYEDAFTVKPSKGKDFPIPDINDRSMGDLYLRCDEGNPGDVFGSIEALPKRHMFYVSSCEDVRIDNLCIKYVGQHGIGGIGKCVRGLTVTNCEIGWIGGSIQNYYGVDPNYPEGGRGTVTRYGNAVEIYGGCDRYRVDNCYIYQVYDTGITHQITSFSSPRSMTRISYTNNLIERCVYTIEYFLNILPEDTESAMDVVEIRDNILRLAGYGWGQQRHNKDVAAHIKGWSSYVNTARHFSICGNIFDRSAYRLIHTVALDGDSLPRMENNIYIQTDGGLLGQYGASREREPEMLLFGEDAEDKIRDVFGDPGAVVCRAESADNIYGG